MDSDECIRCAGATGDHGNAWSIGQLAMRLSHVGRAAFMTADDGFNIGFIQAVKNREEAFTRDFENPFHIVGLQC